MVESPAIIAWPCTVVKVNRATVVKTESAKFLMRKQYPNPMHISVRDSDMLIACETTESPVGRENNLSVPPPISHPAIRPRVTHRGNSRNLPIPFINGTIIGCLASSIVLVFNAKFRNTICFGNLSMLTVC